MKRDTESAESHQERLHELKASAELDARLHKPPLKPKGQETLYIDGLRELGFTDQQVKLILAVEGIMCMACRDNWRDCQCSNDE